MAKQTRKAKANRRRSLTFKDALRNVRKLRPGLSVNTQRLIAQRHVMLDKLALHVDRYRQEHRLI